MKRLTEIRCWLEATYGLNVDVMGTEALDRIVNRRMENANLPGISDYLRWWRDDPEERMGLLQEMLVSETWFFREPPAFEVLKQWLLERMPRWTSGQRLRVLVIACASGEEAWSVAAVIHALGIPGHQVAIEAMDMNAEAISLAQNACYPVRKLREDMRHGSLGVMRDGMIEINPDLHGMVHFEVANVMDSGFFDPRPNYDAIFCRNLLIYLGLSARQDVFKRIASKLSRGGLLFLGHAEQPPSDQGWHRIRVSGAFAWERRDADEVGEPTSSAIINMGRSRGG